MVWITPGFGSRNGHADVLSNGHADGLPTHGRPNGHHTTGNGNANGHGNGNGNGHANGHGNGNGHGHGDGAAAERGPAGTAVLDLTAEIRPEIEVREHVSLVIPTLNEARNITWVLERVPPEVDEIVIVDGRSTDDTVDVARAVRPDVVVVHERRPGKGTALRTGFSAASGDILVMLDADGSMHPAEIRRYLGLLSSGFDFVKGSRFMAGGDSTDITPLRRLGNRVLVGMVNRMYHGGFSDLCYGYCAFRRRHLDELTLTAAGFEIETQLNIHAMKAGLRVCEVPSNETPRHNGTSNLSTFRDGQRVLRTIVSEWLAPRNDVAVSGPASWSITKAVAGSRALP